MKLYNKKGISPLIATVLVIGFTIVLAGVVMQFIMPLFVQSGDKAKADAAMMRTCGDFGVSLAIKSATVDTKGLQIAVDNPTSTNIQYLIVKYYTKSGSAGSCKYYAGEDTVEHSAIPAGGIASMYIGLAAIDTNPKYVAGNPSASPATTTTTGLIGMDGTTTCIFPTAITNAAEINKVEITPAVFMKETKETKPCGSVTVSATVY